MKKYLDKETLEKILNELSNVEGNKSFKETIKKLKKNV